MCVCHVEFNYLHTVPVDSGDWLTTVVTPVPKNPVPLADYRPISVAPILSRVVEKLFVQQWLRPAIPTDMLADKFGFHLTGSTTCVSSTHCCLLIFFLLNMLSCC